MPDYSFKVGVLTNPVSVHIDGSAPDAAALLGNTPPGNAPVTIASAEISIQGAGGVPAIADISSVKFSAGTSAEIAILPAPTGLADQITANIDLADQITPALQFPAAPQTHYAFLRWTYDVSGSVNGSVALGGGATVTFGADADRGGLFALVRQIPDTNPATGNANGCDDIVRSLIANWRLPKQVIGIDSIEPGTWIVAEANGSLGWNVGIQYGYNLNWIRKATIGTLTGDIGLKLQIGLAASLSSSVSGKHAIVISRGASGPDASRIALRLYRLNVRDWKGGVSASLDATPDNTLIPADLDDLIAGALGTSGAQIVKDLKDVDSWTDPTQPLLGPLTPVTSEYLQKFFKDVTGTDLVGDITAVKNQLQSALTTWNNLPQATTKLIWSKLPAADEIASIANLAGEIGTADAASLQKFLASKLTNIPFLDTAAGQWLESLVSNDLFSALQNSGQLATIQGLANDVKSILDGDKVQSLLTNLQQAISSRLDLAGLKNITDQLSVDNLDQWLMQKLSAFLGAHAPAALADLTNLRDQIHRIAAMRNEFYAKAMDALSKTYTFSFNATWESTTTTDALIDAVFNFDVDAADAGTCLASVLNGDLNVIFSGNHPGMTVNQGVLTHGVKKQSTVELTLPYFDQTTTHINNVLSSITAIDHGEGRLLTVNAADEVTQVTNKRTSRDSTLSLAMSVAAQGATGIAIHDAPTATGSYTLTDTFTQKSRARFIDEYQTDVETYFNDEFAPPAAPFTQYAADLSNSNDGDLGAGTISLEITLPPRVVTAWMEARNHPDQTDVIYKQIARTVLGNYRNLLLRQYFTDTSRYGLNAVESPAYALVAYASVPLTFTDATIDSHQQVTATSNDASTHLHWNEAGDLQITHAMLQLNDTKFLLGRKLDAIHSILVTEGNPNAGRWANDDINIGNFVNAARAHPNTQTLFDIETGIALDIRAACLDVARFLNGAGGQADVFGAFENFASGLTRSFSNDIRNLWASDMLLLPLGPFLLQQAAAVFDASLAQLKPGAMLTIKASNVVAPQSIARVLPPAAFVANPNR